jgi:Flp pilus assembly protein TadD
VSGFVVCPSCGTRIRAGRQHCLRCFEPLPDPDAPQRAPLSESLGLSRNTEIMVGAGAAVIVGVLIYFIWQTWPVPEDVPVATSTTAPSTAGSAAASSSAAANPEAALPEAVVPSVLASTDPELETARADYEQRLAARPKDADMTNKLGETLERMGRLDDAATTFEKAVTLQPLDPTYRNNLGRVAGELGQWDRAINQYREVVRLRPKDVEALSTLGVALQQKDDHQAAIAVFRKARDINPTLPAVSLGLATSLEKAGMVDDAAQEFKRYLDLHAPAADAARVRAHLALLSRGTQVK